MSSISDAIMVQCNDVTQIEVHPAYDFAPYGWYRLPKAEKIIIIEERSRNKISRGNNGGAIISQIRTEGNGMVQDNIRKIHQRISSIESNTYVQSRATGSIMGGRNEKAALISRNNNQYNNCLVGTVKVNIMNNQVTTIGYNIDDPGPGTISVNELNKNTYTCPVDQTLKYYK